MKTLVPASEAVENVFPALELTDSYEVPLSLLCADWGHTLLLHVVTATQSHPWYPDWLLNASWRISECPRPLEYSYPSAPPMGEGLAPSEPFHVCFLGPLSRATVQTGGSQNTCPEVVAEASLGLLPVYGHRQYCVLRTLPWPGYTAPSHNVSAT